MDGRDYKPTRLAGAQRAAKQSVRKRWEVSPNALVGLVSYADTAAVEFRPTPLRGGARMLERCIDGLKTRGSTNIGDGLFIAANEVHRNPNGGCPRILLLTDGHHNTGPNRAVKELATNLKAGGLQLDIIGIGGSPQEVDEELLKAMASVVDGHLRYWFIESVGELVQRFRALALREVK
jgi:Mg-chelatase subunit ChlD